MEIDLTVTHSDWDILDVEPSLSELLLSDTVLCNLIDIDTTSFRFCNEAIYPIDVTPKSNLEPKFVLPG